MHAAVTRPRLRHDVIRRLIRRDEGQDLIEYGILTAIVIAIGVLVFTSINTKMGNAYATWGTQIQDRWIPNAPTPPAP